jgi:hypothetical protein
MKAVDFNDWIHREYYLHYCKPSADGLCLEECIYGCPMPYCYRKREDSFHHKEQAL